MPPTTVAGDCAGSPGQIVCAAPFTLFYGPSTSTAAVGSSIIGTLANRTNSVSVSFNPGSNPTTIDDTYAVSYSLNGSTFIQGFGVLRPGSDPLGSYRSIPGPSSNFFVFNMDSALSGSLDYVQLAAFERFTPNGGAELAFLVFGRETTPPDMPTTGTAQFAGRSRGTYITGNREFFTTASDVTLSANFGSGSVTGAANNFRFMNENGVLSTRSERLDFAFTASIAAGTSRFSGTASSTGGLGINGRVEGMFFGGPGRTPEEAGFAYAMGTPGQGAYMNGGAVLGRTQ